MGLPVVFFYKLKKNTSKILGVTPRGYPLKDNLRYQQVISNNISASKISLVLVVEKLSIYHWFSEPKIDNGSKIRVLGLSEPYSTTTQDLKLDLQSKSYSIFFTKSVLKTPRGWQTQEKLLANQKNDYMFFSLQQKNFLTTN